MKTNKIALFALSVVGFVATPTMTEAQQTSSTSELGVKSSPIVGAKKLNATTVEIILQNQQKILLDFYGNNIFRYFLDPSGNSFRKPQAKPEAEILIPNARKKVQNLSLNESGSNITIDTDVIAVVFDKKSGLFSIKNKKNNQWVVKEASPVEFQKNRVVITLKEQPNEYFYGGGVQNGRFSHKGRAINIVNENSWTDGGVASPKPFYWSTEGYGFMWYTFKKGKYDFGTRNSGVVKLQHDTNYADVFFMVSETPVGLLNDYYQLTGNPVLLPKFGFYQGHLNAYNRDYWKEAPKGILFEDGKKYKESQKDNGGIKESLNGEKNNYQFSARAVVDRYSRYDMPLGWILPNDGYGAGYGQTNTLEGNIQNLKQFTEYANKHGVEVGLWTQSDLHPKKGIEALLQRDIIKEVKDAGVRVLKTDVAWVGAGYSFGLNGVQDVAEIMPKYGNDARPFIISLDGWAGTQHYAGIWSGDQTGGNWEYIRFHIPTYLGSGLSGQPNISSDMDGIFGGKNPIVNIRDFQWKTFTPMQLNMDGWGANPKYPHILGEPTTSINRNYLKLKSELMPYIYSVANEAVDGDPIVRAMLLAEPNPYTLGKATEYQFLCGENFLVAPIYQATQSDDKGNDVRNNIYLPQGLWIDYFSGDVYQGGQVINNFDAPIWKLPVFVKAGAIIPMANPNNNVSEIDKALRIYDIYPHGKSSFTAYDDDGLTQAYLKGKSTKTIINSDQDRDRVKVVVEPTNGDFKGFVKEKIT
ncbi:TIM-barrel domain-containing protein [Ornithobacterium rhinotracheale]